MTDKSWYRVYEALCELDVPAMIHVAASCNVCHHGTGAHYLNADTSVFMQLLQGEVFNDFPSLRLVIPHGGGAVPYHWGRYRGMSLEMAKRPLEGLLDNVFFDTCVYHHPGVELLTKVDSDQERAVRLRDGGRRARPRSRCTGEYFDDTKRYIDASARRCQRPRTGYAIFEGNARRVYPRLDANMLKAKGL